MAVQFLVTLAVPATAADPAPGVYRLTGEREVASALILRPDGSYEYFLSVGALDERSHGQWRADGKRLHLTTLPKPVAATFAAGTRGKTADAAFVLHVTGPGQRGLAGVDLRVGFDRGEDQEGYTQEYGWSMPSGETRAPRWVEFAIPMFGLHSQRFAIDLAGGNELTFVLTPNDLGVIDFSETQVDVEPGRLILHRDGGSLTFEAETRAER